MTNEIKKIINNIFKDIKKYYPLISCVIIFFFFFFFRYLMIYVQVRYYLKYHVRDVDLPEAGFHFLQGILKLQCIIMQQLSFVILE